MAMVPSLPCLSQFVCLSPPSASTIGFLESAFFFSPADEVLVYLKTQNIIFCTFCLTFAISFFFFFLLSTAELHDVTQDEHVFV